MEVNRATTLAKVLARDRALEARERLDNAVRQSRLTENEAYPGSKKFPQLLQLTIQYLTDLSEVKISSIKDAHEQTGIPPTGQTVEDALSALRSTMDTVISARTNSWAGSLSLLQTRTGGMNDGSADVLAEAKRELERQSARICERAESKLDVLLQTSLASAERKVQKSTQSPRTATVLHVLIASPSDVAQERDVLTNVVLEWNATHSKSEGIILMPVKWETHAYPAAGEYAQGIINKQIVDDCDILLGVFWSKLGTATPVAASGTAEEIERLRDKGKHILLYFLTAPLPQSHDPEQWQKLKEYQNTLRRDTLYWEFRNSEELYRLASRHLAALIHRMTAEVRDDIGPSQVDSLSTYRIKTARIELGKQRKRKQMRRAIEISARPHIVPIGYGHLPDGPRRNSGGDWVKPSGYAFTAEELLAGKQWADQGLIIRNDGEPAYQISIPGTSEVGSSKLAFGGTLPRLDKSQGEAILTSVIRRTPNTSILNGLFDEMRQHNVDCITVAVRYRGDNHKVWWATDVEIERNVNLTGGLSIRGFSQRRIKAPRQPS